MNNYIRNILLINILYDIPILFEFIYVSTIVRAIKYIYNLQIYT